MKSSICKQIHWLLLTWSQNLLSSLNITEPFDLLADTLEWRNAQLCFINGSLSRSTHAYNSQRLMLTLLVTYLLWPRSWMPYGFSLCFYSLLILVCDYTTWPSKTWSVCIIIFIWLLLQCITPNVQQLSEMIVQSFDGSQSWLSQMTLIVQKEQVCVSMTWHLTALNYIVVCITIWSSDTMHLYECQKMAKDWKILSE